MKIINNIQLLEILNKLLVNDKCKLNLKNFSFNKICTDTRNIQSGDLFVAIMGENFDGNKFIKQAFELGCVACIVSKEDKTIDIPQIIVSDTRLALGKIAKFIRDNLSSKFIGLTGSVGKTTSKQMLNSVLSIVAKTSATKGNLNNELGVPFTIFDITKNTKYSIIEMGANHLKEIEYLTNIVQPDIALITNIGQAHLEGFGSMDNIAKAKSEIFTGLNKDGFAIINLDDKYAEYLLSKLTKKQNIITFSLKNSKADIFATNINTDFSEFILNNNVVHSSIEITLPSAGEHNIKNALGVASCAIALGISLKTIQQGLNSFETEKGRMQIVNITKTKIINDTYNANPTSVQSSVEVLSREKNNRIFVFADMGELGDNSEQIHIDLAQKIKNKADAFYCFGKYAKYFAKTIGSKAKHYLDIESLNIDLKKEIQNKPNSSVLVKGSRSMQMERVVDFLINKK